MPNRPRNIITEQQWQDAVDAYELGTKHAVQLAADLGASPATVSREFKRRGVVKACRVPESIAPLIAALDANERRRAAQGHAAEAAAVERCAEIDRLMGGMMRNLIAAERAGNLAGAAPDIARVGRVMGVIGSQ